MENIKHKKNVNRLDLDFYINLYYFYNKNTKGFFLKSLLVILFASIFAVVFSFFQESIKSFLINVLHSGIIQNRTLLEKNTLLFIGILTLLLSAMFSIIYYFFVKIKYMKIEYQKSITAAYTILLLDFSRVYAFKKIPDQEISEKLEMYNSRARSGVAETFSLLMDIPKSLCSLLILLLLLGAFTKAYTIMIFLPVCVGFYFRIKLDNESRNSHTEQSANRIMIQNSVSIFSQPENMRSFENTNTFLFFNSKLEKAQNQLRDFSVSFSKKRSETMALAMFLDSVLLFSVLIYFVKGTEYSQIFEKENFLKSASFCLLYLFFYVKLVKTRALICDLLQKIADAKIAEKVFSENKNKTSKAKVTVNKNQKIIVKNILYKEGESETPIFKNLNFVANAGAGYGLYFPAMSGATLFAKIISGQKSITSGVVKNENKIIYFPAGNIFPPKLTVFEKIFGEKALFKDDEQFREVKSILDTVCLDESIFSRVKITSSEKVLIKYARLMYLIKSAELEHFVIVDYDQDGLPDTLYKKVVENIMALCKEKGFCLIVIHSNKKIQDVFEEKFEVSEGKLIKSI